MKTEVKTITPTQAAEWLKPTVNVNNRALRNTHVKYLAAEILAGRWRESHQGIAFAKGGTLLDGQHRLAAIVMAGKSAKLLISTELDAEAFKVMDCGLKRANFERIHLVDDGLQNRLICMAIRTYLYETGSHDAAISVGQIEDEFLSRDVAWMWVGAGFSGANGKLRKAGVLASFGIYRFVSPDRAEEFLEGYRSGTGLEAGSPILKLRNDALTGTERDTGYWRSQSIMRSHLQNKPVIKVYEASEDMMGSLKPGRSNVTLVRKVREKLKAAKMAKK